MKRLCTISLLLLAVSFGMVCAEGEKEEPEASVKKEEAKMKITSNAFKEGEMIPTKFTCDSVDVSPQLSISDVPAETKSLALICDDPDAPMGTWVHWVVYNLSPNLKELPEGISRDLNPVIGTDSSGTATQGMTDFKRLGYGGPCPPRGPAHRYFFKLYALDMMLEFGAEKAKKGVTAKVLTEAMKSHILAEASLMGKYKR
jgi:Raf kinase inhibitor-like YbhB/YbcL family protein